MAQAQNGNGWAKLYVVGGFAVLFACLGVIYAESREHETRISQAEVKQEGLEREVLVKLEYISKNQTRILDLLAKGVK
jgi:uncharacterized protein (UPF0212 family)